MEESLSRGKLLSFQLTTRSEAGASEAKVTSGEATSCVKDSGHVTNGCLNAEGAEDFAEERKVGFPLRPLREPLRPLR